MNKTWLSVETDNAGQTLVDASRVVALNWPLNVREEQTRAEIVFDTGQVISVHNFPRAPVVALLTEEGTILNCQWERKKEPEGD